MLDIVLTPTRRLETGTDVPGRVTLVQGGSAANTARWLGVWVRGQPHLRGRARSGGTGARGCGPRRRRHGRASCASPGARRDGSGSVVAPGGERSFVADRGAADRLSPTTCRGLVRGARIVHLPVYSLLGEPLGQAGRRAIALGRAAGAAVSIDLASIGPLLAGGRRAARA